MRNMSFALTTEACRAKRKLITRRLGWSNVQVGEMIQQVVKAQGLKRGEKVEKLHVVRVVGVRREELDSLLLYSPEDLAVEMEREGFPGMSAAEFLQMFCKANACRPDQVVTRIVMEYVEDEEAWVSCWVRLPEDMATVLVTTSEQSVREATFNDGRRHHNKRPRWHIGRLTCTMESVTHWRPMPAPAQPEALIV